MNFDDYYVEMQGKLGKCVDVHSVLEQIEIKHSYIDQILPRHESLYQQELKSYTLGTFLLSKMSLNVITVKLLLH